MYVRLNSSNPDAEPWRVERLHYAQDYHRKCAYCGGPMRRNDLAVIVTEPYPPASDLPGELRKAKRTKVYHRACWFAEQGRPDWYYPGALADAGVGLDESDPAAKEDMPEAVEGAQASLEPDEAEATAELPGALPPPVPRPAEPASTEAQPDMQTKQELEKLAEKKRTTTRQRPPANEDELVRRLRRAGEFLLAPPPPIHPWEGLKSWLKYGPRRKKENPMGRRRRNPSYIPSSPDVNIYTGSPGGGAMGAPASYRYEGAPKRGMSGLAFLLIILALGGAAFAGYWFLVRARYGVGQMLQHTAADNTTVTYQITALKYSGLTHEYVMTNQSTQHPETFSVSSVDSDTAHWIPVS